MHSGPLVLETPAALRAWAEAHLAAGRRVALVPTMGYLHAGHLSLVDEAKRRADVTVASIFVNPTQFGPREDLARYPRDLAGDLEKLRAVDAVFVPSAADMYPPGFDTFIVPDALAQGLCGRSRPTHFRGVCTVVLMLLRMSRCHVAVFGEKDFQQLQIIRRMVRDLWLDVEVVGAPIVREADGLAMSSRNAYLSAGERARAPVLQRSLRALAARVAGGEVQTEVLRAEATAAIEAAGARVDYVEIVDQENLAPIERVAAPAVAAVAAFFGTTRLIDNQRLSPPPARG